MMRRFLAIIAIGLAVGGCSRLSSEQISEVAKEITVLIDGCNAGSGVIFKHDSNTYSVLTAHHVVKNTTGNCLILTPDGERYQASNQVREPIAGVDLAVLTFESSKTYKLAEWGDSEKVTVGKVVYVAGAPAPSEAIPTRTLLVTEGKVLGIVPQPFEGYAFIYNNTTNGGMSGGPMLNEEGRVIGIHGKGDKQEGIDTGRKLGIPTKIFLALNLENTRPQNIPWLNGLLFSLIHIIAIDILFISSITIFFLVTDKNSIDINLDFAFRVITVLLNPGFFIAIFFYGVIFLGGELGAVFYYTQGEYQNAINRYDKLIWINANWDFNYNNRGLAYSDLGDKQNAISDYNQAIQLNPNYADAYYNRGNAYSYLGDKQNAISDYTQAIQLDPKNANAYTGRGYAYSDLGDKQNAIADFQKAAELYKQQGNQVWYQNALNQIKKLQSSDTP